MSLSPSLHPSSLLSERKVGRGNHGGKATLIHFLSPPGALIEKFGWPCLFILVECGGLCFWRLFLSDAAPQTSGESSDGGHSIHPHPRLLSMQYAPPGSLHPVADLGLHGVVSGPSQTWIKQIDRQRAEGRELKELWRQVHN